MTTDFGTERVPIGRREVVFLALVVIAIVASRAPSLGTPLLDGGHAHRQTQTAFQTVVFHESGIDLLHPVVPVFGDQREFPFEFPLFQAVASVPMSWGVSADVANRVTALGFFVLTALLLWWVVRRIATPLIAAVTIVVFSFTPFALLWSRASLMEYLATAGALGWVAATMRWRSEGSPGWIAVGTASGAIAAMVKITTAVPWGVLVFLHEPDSGGGAVSPTQLMRRRLRFGYLALAAIPAAAGMWWGRHADAIKEAGLVPMVSARNPLEWLDSQLFSHIPDAANLTRVADRVETLLLWRGVAVLAVVALVAMTANRWSWTGMALVPVVGIFGFFYLYLVHDYYLAAMSPALAALFGLAIVTGVQMSGASVRWVGPVAMAVTCGWILLGLWSTAGYWRDAYREIPLPTESLEIASVTGADDRVLVGGYDWDPRILYYAEREGLMLYEAYIDTSDLAAQRTLDSYRAMYVGSRLSHLVEWAEVRPWWSPVSANLLLLGSSRADLGDVDRAATSHEVVLPEGSVISLATDEITCGVGDELQLGSSGTWVEVRSTGAARPVLGGGLVPVPSTARFIWWDEGVDATLECVGDGSLRILTAVGG